MKWRNLEAYECPSCGGQLRHIVPRGHECTKCPFLISDSKLQEIIHKRSQAKPFMSEDNSEALNNLGHKGISEDFSDSRYLNY